MKMWKKGRVTLATEELRKAVAGKKIALMMNTSAIDNEGRLLLDVIVEEKWTEVAFFFGMEHGVRGNLYAADSNVGSVDEKTGISIVNLYECPELAPQPEHMEQVDAVVFCAQDVGVRHWTYTPWMMKLIDSAAKAGKEVIILDRPNPIRGDIVEGACCETKFVGYALLSGFEYPLRHGMTIGELALMYNDVRNVGCNLTVLKMQGWTRNMWYEETGLVWMPPSPNMPTVDTALFFAATGLFQSSSFSFGSGTTTPFQYVGAPGISGDALARELNSRDLEGVYFAPKYYKARCCGYEEMPLCDGVMMILQDRDRWRPVKTQLNIMDASLKLFPEKLNLEVTGTLSRPRMGTDDICQRAKEGQNILDLIPKWEQEAEEFKKTREKYLLY